MSKAVVNGVDFDSEQPCIKHTVTWNGRTFTAGSLLLAALFAFQDWLDLKHPGLYVYVIQGAYNTDVEASAGTHDKDGVVDIAIVDRRTGKRVWVRGSIWLRRHHFYAWLRNSGSWLSPSKWHFHMIVVGILDAGCPVGDLVPGQVVDALAHRSGLVGHVLDPAPAPRKYVPFPYRAWVKRQELLMAKLDSEDLAAIRGIVAEEVEKGWQIRQPNGLTRAKNLVGIALKAGLKPPKKGA